METQDPKVKQKGQEMRESTSPVARDLRIQLPRMA